MDNDPMFNLAFGNGRPIEGATNRPDINVLDTQYQQEQHEQSEFQIMPQFQAAEPIEERPKVLRHFSTVRNGGFRRYSTPPTTPELPAIHPVGLGQNHNILPPHPDLMLTTAGQPSRQPDHIWYSLEFFAGALGPARETMHPLEKAFICNKLGLITEELLLAFKSDFPLAPWSDADIRNTIEQARWHAKLCIWRREERVILRRAARLKRSEEDVWLELRAMWPYYPKDRRTVSDRYDVCQQEVAMRIGYLRYEEDQEFMAGALALVHGPEPEG
jgi:hypothetical protein